MSQQADPSPARRRFAANPVLAREIKERMRSPRATVILVIYLALLAAILYLTYRLGLLSLRAQMFGGGFVGSSMGAAALGRLMFEVLMIFLLGLIAFIAPGSSTGAIAGERERGTLPLLQVTLLRPVSIVLGKLGASLGFVLLLLVASIPLLTVALILGGVTPGQAARGLVVVTVLAVFLATLGTFLSTVARRTLHATIGTYAITFVLLFGTILTYGAERIARSSGFMELTDRPVSTYLNPFAALTDAVVDPRGFGGILPSPLTMVRQMIPSFMPGTGGFSEPPTVITTGEWEGSSWSLTAREDPNAGICVGFHNDQGGSETCGGGVDQTLMVSQAPTSDAGMAIFGPVSSDARKIVVELAEGKPLEVKPLTKESEEAGFEDTTFFIVKLGPDQQATEIRALDKSDDEIGSQRLIDMPMVKEGVVEPGGGMPTLVPQGTPAPPADAVPAPVQVNRTLPAVSTDALQVTAVRPEAAVAADTAPPLPPPQDRILVDPVPAPGFEGMPPEAQRSNDPARVWVVHSILLLAFSVMLVVAGSYQLRRPKVRTGMPWNRTKAGAS